MEIKSFTEAIMMYDHDIQINPNYAETYYNKGKVLNLFRKCTPLPT